MRGEGTTEGTAATTSAPARNAGLLGLIGILIVGTVLRLHRLGDDSLWDNEILSLRRATAPLGEAYDLMREGTHPPLYSQGVLRPWLALGDSELMQRLPSAVFGVAVLALTSVIGTRIAGRAAGLVATGVLTIMPLHLYYSREGRMYALLALMVTAWLGSLLWAHRTNATRAWVAYTVFGAASLYSHYYAGFTVMSTVAATGAFYLLTGEVDAAKRRRWLLATAGIGVAFIPWFPTFWYQLGNDPVAHLPALSVSGVAELPIQFFTGFDEAGSAQTGLIAVTIAVLVTMGLRSLWTSDVDGLGRFPAVVLTGALFGTMALSIGVSALRPLIFVRYFVGILPALALVIGAAFATSIRWRVVAGLAALGLTTASLTHVGPTVSDPWRPEFKAATEQIEADPDTALVVFVGDAPDDFRARGFDYYLDADIAVQEVVGRVDGPAFDDAVARLPSDADVVWILQYGSIGEFIAPAGFDATLTERLPSRFFSRSYPIELTRLQRITAS